MWFTRMREAALRIALAERVKEGHSAKTGMGQKRL